MSEDPKYTHAWNWFALHSQQRQNNIHYAILVAIGILGAVGILIQHNLFAIAVIFSLLGIVMNWLFYGIDRRNSHLVKISEDYFKTFETNNSSENAKFEIFQRADGGLGYLKYSQFAFWFCILMTIAFCMSVLYCLSQLYCLSK